MLRSFNFWGEYMNILHEYLTYKHIQYQTTCWRLTSIMTLLVNKTSNSCTHVCVFNVMLSQLVYVVIFRWWISKEIIGSVLLLTSEKWSVALHSQWNILTLYLLIFSEGTKTYIYILCHSPHEHGTGSWNPSLSKTRTYLSYIINIMDVDFLGDARSQGISHHDIDSFELN